MKKIIACLTVAIALAGCAAADYKNARLKANEVQNGMTVADATRILGLPPSHQSANSVEWRRGDAQAYTGTIRGSIFFELRDGKIVNVPEGGIFSDAARRRVNDKWLAAREAADAERLAAEEKAKQERARKAAQEAEAAKAYAAEEAREMAAEAVARSNARYSCADKLMCGKVFALAQIYVAQNADQKIQVATDTIIETYNPTEPGKLGMSIVKAPGKGTQEVVEITATCKDEGRIYASLCRKKRTAVYAGFQPFINARFQK